MTSKPRTPAPDYPIILFVVPAPQHRAPRHPGAPPASADLIRTRGELVQYVALAGYDPEPDMTDSEIVDMLRHSPATVHPVHRVHVAPAPHAVHCVPETHYHPAWSTGCSTCDAHLDALHTEAAEHGWT